MRRSQDCWDIVPVRLVLGSLAAAGLCAVVGLCVPRFNALAIVLYGTVAVGLILYGLFGSLAATFEEGVWHGIACLLFPAFYPIYFYATHPVCGWKAAPRFRQLMAQRRSDFVSAGEPTALDDRGMSKSITALIKLGPRFRDANCEFQTQWKRTRRQDGLSGILDGTR